MSALHAVGPEVMRAAITLDALKGRTTIDVPTTAKVLGIGRNACYEAIARGEIEALHFGNRIVVPVAPLLRMLGIDT